MQCHDLRSAIEKSDQVQGIESPAPGNAVTGKLISLPPFTGIDKNRTYAELLDIRRSIKAYEDKPISAEQLGFILWSAQGAQAYKNEKSRTGTFRPTPIGGGLHPFETYIAVKHVTGLTPGLYRYVPLENVGEKQVSLEMMGTLDDYENKIATMLAGQKWVSKASAVLFFSCAPYRAEWRYGESAHRITLIGLGHVGQNVMLSAAAVGLGSCCLASYDQQLCDKTLGLDGVDEYTVYISAIG